MTNTLEKNRPGPRNGWEQQTPGLGATAFEQARAGSRLAGWPNAYDTTARQAAAVINGSGADGGIMTAAQRQIDTMFGPVTERVRMHEPFGVPLASVAQSGFGLHNARLTETINRTVEQITAPAAAQARRELERMTAPLAAEAKRQLEGMLAPLKAQTRRELERMTAPLATNTQRALEPMGGSMTMHLRKDFERMVSTAAAECRRSVEQAEGTRFGFNVGNAASQAPGVVALAERLGGHARASTWIAAEERRMGGLATAGLAQGVTGIEASISREVARANSGLASDMLNAARLASAGYAGSLVDATRFASSVVAEATFRQPIGGPPHDMRLRTPREALETGERFLERVEHVVVRLKGSALWFVLSPLPRRDLHRFSDLEHPEAEEVVLDALEAIILEGRFTETLRTVIADAPHLTRFQRLNLLHGLEHAEKGEFVHAVGPLMTGLEGAFTSAARGGAIIDDQSRLLRRPSKKLESVEAIAKEMGVDAEFRTFLGHRVFGTVGNKFRHGDADAGERRQALLTIVALSGWADVFMQLQVRAALVELVSERLASLLDGARELERRTATEPRAGAVALAT